MELKDSRTWANLMSAFAGESQARVKYLIYAEQASRQGCELIAGIFRETSDNEQVNAALWLAALNGGQIPDTDRNLEDAAAGEHFEWSEMYREYAETAREEGFAALAAAFELAGKVEKEHEQRYRSLIRAVGDGTLYDRPEKTVWVCRYCGYVHEGKAPPPRCPLCQKPRGFFEVKKPAD